MKYRLLMAVLLLAPAAAIAEDSQCAKARADFEEARERALVYIKQYKQCIADETYPGRCDNVEEDVSKMHSHMSRSSYELKEHSCEGAPR